MTLYTTPRNKIQFERTYPPSMDFLCLVDSLYEQTRDVAEGNGVSYLSAYRETVPLLFSANDRTKALEKAILERFHLLERHANLGVMKDIEIEYFYIQTHYHLDALLDQKADMAHLKKLLQISYRLTFGFIWITEHLKLGTDALYEKLRVEGFDLHKCMVYSGSEACKPYVEVWHESKDRLETFKNKLAFERDTISQVKALQEHQS